MKTRCLSIPRWGHLLVWLLLANWGPMGPSALAQGSGDCLRESFDVAAGFPPAGWLAEGVQHYSTATNTGAGAVQFNSFTGSLTTPVLRYPSTIIYSVARTENTEARVLRVSVSTTSATAGFIKLVEYNEAELKTGYSPTLLGLDSSQPQVWVRFEKISGTTALVLLDDVQVTCSASPSTSAGVINPATFCLGTGGAAISVPFTVNNGPFEAGNTFTAYISSDNFVTKYPLATPQPGTTSGTINGLIPDVPALTTGANYRVRVEASLPANQGQPSPTALALTNYRTNEVRDFAGVGADRQVDLSATLPAACVSRVVIVGRARAAVTVRPTGLPLVANAGFGLGQDLGTVANPGQFVVYDGPAAAVTVTNLTNLTSYFFTAFTSNGAGFSSGASTSVTPVVPATLTEIYLPQYLSGHAVGSSTHATRLPYVCQLRLGNLPPATAFKYYNAAVAANPGATDPPGASGAGIGLYPSAGGGLVRQSLPGLNSGSPTFTTDASGTYTGWFALEPTGNERFEDGDLVRLRLVLNGGGGALDNTPLYFLTTPSTVQVRELGTGPSQATGVQGRSFATPASVVLAYDNVAGTGRPLAATLAETDALDASSYADFYRAAVDGVPGAYGLLLPNDNGAGLRRLEQRAWLGGDLVGCPATAAEGRWPSGANTAAPRAGPAPLVLTGSDAPLAAPTVREDFTASARPSELITINGTGFAAGPPPEVGFAGGVAAAAASVNLAGSQLTVVVPAGARTGPLTVANACAQAATTTADFTVLAPLPIELTRFTAARQPAGVELRWTTATEHNNASFEVQRSTDAAHFAVVAALPSQGNSTQPRAYRYLDHPAPISMIYYRLRQVDLDGTATFSPVRSVGPGSEPETQPYVLFPNPAQASVSFTNPTGAPLPYRVRNLLAQVVQQGLAPTGPATLDLAQLPAGTYVLELLAGAGPVRRRFQKP